jgi:hypothetical protein
MILKKNLMSEFSNPCLKKAKEAQLKVKMELTVWLNYARNGKKVLMAVILFLVGCPKNFL